jgi:acyl-CoA reductase-like NAD-dependent aldehyde dehydrogenase
MEEIAEIAQADEAQLNRAVEAAAAAAKVMRKMPAHERASILEKVSAALASRREEAARIIALEAAKPLKTALAEIDRTIMTYKFSAEEARQLRGEMVPMDAAPGGDNRLAFTLREPIGVIGAITPFNFPMNLVAHKVGPAIASGNTVVLKPASQTPLSAYLIAELFDQAGLPAGALNVVTGSGSTLGNLLVEDPRISMITFTGSPAVGTAIRNRAGLKRVTLELGSNSAVIIDTDRNLDKIVERCVTGAFTYQGQVCISLQRIYVVGEDLYRRFTDEFVKRTGNLRTGDPLSMDTDLSALISPADVSRSLEWIGEAKRLGATVAAGGQAEGNVLRPTVLLNVDPRAKVSCQEVFAPIVLINAVKSVEEAISLVNDSDYGLQAGIYTDDVHAALHAAESLEAGGVLINDIPTFRVDHMPYGGVKMSGMGREGVKYAMEEMTERKLVIFNRN